ncbi:phage antirepressor [Yersinia mollaretii]|uniref:BRO-N domain-containing protein n=1 Tax=Yersinia mollaretii TaxID=33060 RepID=UPI0005DD524A|nr:BRO family protein [Yersinia mollaretii]CQJ12660.1 phage antirepressor [Yersinia mollaretii]
MKSIAKVKSNFTSFKFDGQDVRVITKDGEPWFLASDLCDVLHLDTTSIRKLDDDEKGLHSIQTLGGAQKVAVLSESGMWTLVLRCRDAVRPGTIPYRVRKWVTSEVLPSIRKTGEYKNSKSSSVVLTEKECRYRVRVIIYDDLMGGCAEMFGKGETMRDIAYGVANDLGYRPNTFTTIPMNREKLKRVF